MAGSNRWEKVRRSTAEETKEHRRWARAVLDGATLAELRALLDRTQEAIGEDLKVSQVQAGRIEKGGEEMQVSTLRRYLDALGMELELFARSRAHPDRLVPVRLPPAKTEAPSRARKLAHQEA